MSTKTRRDSEGASFPTKGTASCRRAGASAAQVGEAFLRRMEGWDVEIADATNGTWNNLPIRECLKFDTKNVYRCINIPYIRSILGIELGIHMQLPTYSR